MTPVLSALVNGAIPGAVVTALVWLVLRATPRRVFNAATRYMVWWATLGVVVILPLLYLPFHFAPSPSQVVDISAPIVEETLTSVDTAPAPIEPAVFVETTSPAPTQARAFPIEFTAGRWPQRLLTAWAAIALLMLVRLAVSCAMLERRKARAFAPPASIAGHLSGWLVLCGATRKKVRLAASSEISTPMAAGLRRPSILIPARLFDELDEAELDQIGLHETAHLARGDDYALILQRIVEALFALHPVVRWITRRIDLEREIACDDFVIESTGGARPYAACLTRVVELAGGVRASLAAAAATEEGSHLARRVEMLLDKTRHTGTRLLKARFTAVVAALIALAWIAARTPALVAFAMPQDTAFEQIPESPQPPIPPTPGIAPEAPQPPAAPRIPRGFAPPAPMAPFEPVTPPAPPAAFAPEAPQDPTPPPDPPERRLGVGIGRGFGAGSGWAMAPPAPWAPQTPPPPAAPAPPAPQTPPTPPSGGGSFFSSHSDGEHNFDWHWRDGLSARDLRAQGNIEFTDDESDIKSMSPGSWFSFEESHGFASRRFQAMADGSGNITRKYLVDGREVPLDDQGRAWLRAAIPEMLRETGFDVAGRVRRIMGRGGAQAVIAEIGRIQSNGAKRRYIQELIPIGNLNKDQLQTVFRIVREISSDGDKASLLISLSRYSSQDSLRDYVFEAVSTIHSSGDRRRVLMNYAQQDPSRATLTAVARSAEGIQSDGDKASVLIELAGHYRTNEDMRRPFFRTAESINSSGDRARVLMAVVGNAGDHRDTLVDALRATAGIPSDGDKARVLIHAAGYWKDDDTVRRAYFEAANAVNSSGDHARVLNAVLGRSGVSSATLIDGVHSADRIQSDGDKAHVLMSVIQRSEASNDVLIAAVQAAAHLSSDGDKGRVLLEAAQRASGKPAVRSEIRNALRTLHSDGEYRRVMSVLDKETAI
jgi:beta-lactamase regulating signal transducer with metallopeptidase domain